MQPIYTQRIGATPTSTINFNNIPQTFRDLYFLISIRSNSGNTYDPVSIRFNGSSSGYTQRLSFSLGASVGGQGTVYTDKGFVGDQNGATSLANAFSNTNVWVTNYAGSNLKNFMAKSIQVNNIQTQYPEITAGLWSNSAPITSVSFLTTNGQMIQDSFITMYGVLNHNSPITSNA
jgi:hypothetical protein